MIVNMHIHLIRPAVSYPRRGFPHTDCAITNHTLPQHFLLWWSLPTLNIMIIVIIQLHNLLPIASMFELNPTQLILSIQLLQYRLITLHTTKYLADIIIKLFNHIFHLNLILHIPFGLIDLVDDVMESVVEVAGGVGYLEEFIGVGVVVDKTLYLRIVVTCAVEE